MSLSYQTVAIAAVTNATSVLVAARAGRSVRVHGFALSNAGTAGQTAQFQGTGNQAISGAFVMGQHQPFICQASQIGCFVTPQGAGLQVVAGASATLNGWVRYSVE